MIINFDSLGMLDRPNVQICTPSKKPIASIGKVIFDTEVSLRFNSMSEFSFTIPQKTNKSAFLNAYNEVVSKRVIFVENIGYFLVVSVNESDDGIRKVKHVKCYSLEAELNYKKINLFSGTYKFYDAISPQNSLLGKIVAYLPSWSIGYIDPTLYDKYRTYEVSDQTIYNFLMTTVEQSVECVFTFDTASRLINAYSTSSAVTDTSIFLSFSNLLKETQVEEMSEELVTALHCYGGGDLDIRTVNPLGNPLIYNFDYFLYSDKEWFSDELKTAVLNWKTKIGVLQPQYATLLTTFRNTNLYLITLNGQLVTLQGEYTALEAVQKARIEAGLSFSEIYTQLIAKQNEIDLKKNQIIYAENSLESISTQLTAINVNLSFVTNFTTEQYKELSNYIIESTYQNDAFIQTSIMTPVEIQDMSQELYNQSTNVLNKLSQPRYTFSVDSVNFLFLKEFKRFSDQLKLGCQINVEVNEDVTSYPVLLEMSFSFDDLTNFNLTFGNRLRLDKNDFVFAELFGDSVSSGATVSFNTGKWNEFNNNYEDDVSKFINNSLDCAKNNVINATNQEIVIDSNGLKGQRYIPETDTYSPEKIWVTSNSIAMTKDNWQTASLAMGKLPNGAYGIVSELLFGSIIAGNQLQISNSNNNFLLDSNGCVLSNASFTMTTSNNKGKIILDANAGIKIQGNTGSGFTDKFYVDTDGNVNFTGKLNGATGSFSGELTSATFKSGSININDRFKVDALGNCIANSISISGGNFASGSISGTNITGGSLNIGNGNFTVDTYGRCTASDIDIIGGSINIDSDATVGGNLKLKSSTDTGYINFYNSRNEFLANISGVKDMIIVNSRFECEEFQCYGGGGFNGNIYMNNNDLVATQDWVNSQIPSSTNFRSGGAHNHGISDGEKLALDGGGYVTWDSYSGFSHNHSI